jgi:hypothetical protein
MASTTTATQEKLETLHPAPSVDAGDAEAAKRTRREAPASDEAEQPLLQPLSFQESM